MFKLISNSFEDIFSFDVVPMLPLTVCNINEARYKERQTNH